MREIKFRAWDKTKKTMLIDPNIMKWSKNPSKLPIDVSAWNLSVNEIFMDGDFVFMQFTGLKDKNGKEIYEGDVVKYDTKIEGFEPNYTEKMFEVFWDKKEAKFNLNGNEVWGMIYKGYEIIGNIWENGELLK